MEGKIRVKIAGELGKEMPPFAKILIEAMKKDCNDSGRIWMRFSVPGLPTSLNRMYDRATIFCRAGEPGAFQDKQGRWRRTSQKLTKSSQEWKLELMQAMGTLRHKWRPTGITGAILLFESPHWLTAQRTVRQMDADNRVKLVFDAIQQATETKDELHFKFYVEKIPSKRQRTTIFLFDLGGVVEFYY